MKKYKKMLSLLLAAIISLEFLPLGEILGLRGAAVAVDASLVSEITSEATSKAAAIRSAVDAAMPLSPEQINSKIATMKKEIDNVANATIKELNTMKAELQLELKSWEEKASKGEFLAEIGVPDPNAIKIYTAEDLANISNTMYGSYVLMNDIDLSLYNGGVWKPLTNEREYEGKIYKMPFTGTFDGQGYEISNMTVHGGKNNDESTISLGLFSSISNATIKNVKFTDATFDVSGSLEDITHVYMGATCGSMYGSLIENCSVSGRSEFIDENGILSNMIFMGGICGTSTESDIRDCFSAASIIYNAKCASVDIGGIIGSFYSSNNEITHCYNIGNIDVKSGANYSYNIKTGGIIASVDAQEIVRLDEFYNAGDISVNQGYAGGIIGLSNSVSVLNSFNTGDIYTLDSSGDIGGIAGSVSDIVRGCYNSGFVGTTIEIPDYGYYSSNNVAAGGISAVCGGVENCFNSGDVSGIRAAGGNVAELVRYDQASVTSFSLANSGRVVSSANAGGIIGRKVYDSAYTFMNCYNAGEIKSYDVSSGIIGESSGLVQLSNCYNDAAVNSACSAGGIIANLNSNTGFSIKHCRNTGAITSSNTVENALYNGTGGIMGNAYDYSENGSISHCYNSGTIMSKKTIGGLLGIDAITGIKIENGLNCGVLSGQSIGGISGSGGKITNCINAIAIIGDPTLTISISGIGGNFAANCVNIGDITVLGDDGSIVTIVCGITSGSADKCYNSGNITIRFEYSTGVIVGGISADGNSITNCRNVGHISVTYNDTNHLSSYNVAGIAAGVQASAGNCHNTGNIYINIPSSSWRDGQVGGIVVAAESVRNCLNEGSFYISSAKKVGGIVANIIPNNDYSSAIVSECVNLGDINVKIYESDRCAMGGIAAYVYAATISDCQNLGNLALSEFDNQTYYSGVNMVGGVVGLIEAGGGDVIGATLEARIINCTNTSNIYNPYGPAGGIVARLTGYDSGASYETALSSTNGSVGRANITMSGCKNSGSIIVNYCSAGGVVGQIDASSRYLGWLGTTHFEVFTLNLNIQNCENTGNVTQNDIYYFSAGGIIGHIKDGNISMVDNVITKPDEFITNNGTFRVTVGGSINKGIITAYSNAGGIVGAITSSLREDGNKAEYDSLTVTGCRNEGAINSSKDDKRADIFLAGIVGRAAAGVGDDISDFDVSNLVSINACVNNGKISANVKYTEKGSYDQAFAGGIIASTPHYNLMISNCENNGEILAEFAGGISSIGRNSTQPASQLTAKITKCINRGNVSGVVAGGIVDRILAGEKKCVSLDQCVNSGAVSAVENEEEWYSSRYAGGIAGQVNIDDYLEYNSLKISNCYSTGDVMSFGNGGYAGGLVGYISSTEACVESLNNCYNTGTVYSDNNLAGGLVGRGEYINACMSLGTDVIAGDKGTSFAIASANYPAMGLVNNIVRSDLLCDSIEYCRPVDPSLFEGLANKSTYTDIKWDFDTVWKFAPGGGLPVLQWQNVSVGPKLPIGELKILRVNKPLTASMSGRSISYTASYSESSVEISVVPSYGASWALYSDVACTQPVSGNTVSDLKVGANTAYIKLTAAGKDPVVYNINLPREAYVDPNAITRRTITFHAGLADTGKQDVSMDIDWGWDLFDKSSFEYDNRIAIPALALSGAAEISEGQVEAVLKQLRFDKIEHYDYSNTLYTAHTIASKEISLGGSLYTLIAVVVRGTTGIVDAIIDVNPLGFESSATVVKENIEAYASKFGVDLINDNTKFMITGHSLGGAVANLLAPKLADYATMIDTFTYTFASPLTIHTKFERKGIFNIVNKHDGVPHLSSAMASHRIGEDIRWERDSRVDTRFNLLTGGKSLASIMDAQTLLLWEYSGQELSKFFAAHDTTTYMAYLLSRGDAGEAYTYRIKVAAFKCPVDVYVYNGKGDLVGRVIDNVPEFTDVFIWVVDDEKYVYMPFEDNYTFEIISTDEGTMDFELRESNLETGENELVKSFENISLTNDRRFAGAVVTAFGEEAGEQEYSDAYIYTTNTQGELLTKVLESGEEIGADAPLESISLSADRLELSLGSVTHVNVLFNPILTTDDKTVSWESSNEKVAIVEDGTIIVTGSGAATITATVGSLSAALQVAVMASTGGVSISGEVRSYDQKKMTEIILYETGTENEISRMTIEPLATGSGQVTQAFALDGVPDGTYDLVFHKPGHLSYTITEMTVASEDIDLTANSDMTQSIISLISGDITGDGYINSVDLTLFLSEFGRAPENHLFADIDGNGVVNSVDLTLFLAGFGKSGIRVAFSE